MRRKLTILWTIFILNTGAVILSFAGQLWQPLSFIEAPMYGFVIGLPVIQTILHSSWTILPKRAVLLLGLACIIGFVSEVTGIHFGSVFGVVYVYRATPVMILGVPIEVILFWGAFIYMGYSITNSLVLWSGRALPSFKNKAVGTLLILIFLDAAFVTAIDIFMDPIQVKNGAWIWLQKGPYFGIPLTNFSGWFLVAGLTSAIFRTIQYWFPTHDKTLPPSVLLIPVLSYGFMALSFAVSAFLDGMVGLMIIGLSVTLPQTILSLFTYYKFRSIS